MEAVGEILDRTRDGGAVSKQTSAARLNGFDAEDVGPADKESGSHSLVAMMKSAEDREGDNFALVRALDFAGDRAVSIPMPSILSEKKSP